mgnify:CR=1 FL=1
MLEIKNVYKTFNAGTVNEKVALQDLNLTLEDGDFVTVIGGNGAGKSTMLNAVAGVWPIDMAKILIDGQDPPVGASARQVHRPCLSGPDDGHRRHHGH